MPNLLRPCHYCNDETDPWDTCDCRASAAIDPEEARRVAAETVENALREGQAHV